MRIESGWGTAYFVDIMPIKAKGDKFCGRYVRNMLSKNVKKKKKQRERRKSAESLAIFALNINGVACEAQRTNSNNNKLAGNEENKY